jgi:hypothetical protein
VNIDSNMNMRWKTITLLRSDSKPVFAVSPKWREVLLPVWPLYVDEDEY